MSGPDRRQQRNGADRRRAASPRRHSPHARGGAVEGLAWLGRPPEAKASLLYRLLRLVGRFVLFVCSGSGSGPRARSTCRRAATCWSRPRIAAGWIRSWSCTRSRRSRAPGSSAAHRRRSPRAGGSGSSIVSVGCSRSGAAASGSTSTSPRRRPSSPTGPSSSRCPRERSAGRRAGSGRSAPAGRSSPCGRTPPIVPLAIAGTEELYLGRRMASQVLPATTVRALAGLAPDGAALPAEGSREELAMAAPDERRARRDPRTGRRGAPPLDGRPAGASAPARQAADLAAAATRPARPRCLTAAGPERVGRGAARYPRRDALRGVDPRPGR